MTPPHANCCPNCRANCHAGCRGFTLLAVLLLVSLIGMLGATYTRHVTIIAKSSSVAASTLRARAAVDSGVQYARQSLRTGRAVAGADLDTGGAVTALAITDLGGDRSRVQLRSVDGSGIGATVLLEAALTPRTSADDPDDLPRLKAAKVAALLADAAVQKTWISASTTLTNTDVTGLLIVQNGVTLTLDGVVVSGAIVSAVTMTAASYGAFDAVSAPRVVVAGDLRVTPGSFLRGVAMVLPDGVVQGSSSSSRLQLDGAVVAHALTLSGSGSVRGNVATVTPASLAAGVERPGAGRAPRAWASDLDLGGAWDTASLASVPRVHAPSDLPAITGYDFDDP